MMRVLDSKTLIRTPTLLLSYKNALHMHATTYYVNLLLFY